VLITRKQVEIDAVVARHLEKYDRGTYDSVTPVVFDYHMEENFGGEFGKSIVIHQSFFFVFFFAKIFDCSSFHP